MGDSNDEAVVEPNQEADGANQTEGVKDSKDEVQATARANQTEGVKDSKDEVQAVAPKKRAVRPPVRCRVWCGSKGRVLEDSDDDRTDREKQDSSKVQEQPPQAPLDESKGEDDKNVPKASEAIKSD